jgi:transcriptional regulator of met regulon
MSDPNWAEQVTAIATSIGVIGLLATIVVAIVAGRQVREARHARQSQIAADFVRRWDDQPLVETRRLVAEFKTPEQLRDAFQRYIATNAPEAYVLYRELDYFEQLGALERVGAVNFDLLPLLLGRRLIDRWEMWKPSIDAMGDNVYPMLEALVVKMRAALDQS